MKQPHYISAHKNEFSFIMAYGIFAFFAGIILTYYDVLANAFFWEQFSYKHYHSTNILSGSVYKYYASTYILGGSIGLVLIYLFSIIYKKINTKVLSFLIVTIVTLFSGSYFLFQLILPNKWVVYAGMVLFFPLNTLLLLTIWRYGRKLLTPVQSRFILPKVRLLFFAGIAFSGVSITVVLFIYKIPVVLFFALVAVVLFWISILILNFSYRKTISLQKSEQKYIPVKRNFFLFFTSKYTTYLFWFTCLSAIVGFSIHYAFINISWVEFGNSIGMSKFYGLFLFVLFVFIFGIDRFIIKRILYSYDSPYSLVLIAPIVLMALIITLASHLILGNVLQRVHFSLFFLLVVICKVGYVSTFQIIQTPSLRTLFHSLDLRYRQLANPRVEGSMVMSGLIISGIIILGLSYFKFYSVTIIIAFAILSALAWIWVSVKLIKNYRETQGKELARLRFKHAESTEYDEKYDQRIRSILIKNEPEKVIETLKITARIQPFEYEKNLIRILSHPSQKVRHYALNCIIKENIEDALPDIEGKIEEVTSDEKDLYIKAANIIKKRSTGKVTESLVKEKINSGSIEERVDLAFSLSKSEIPDKESILIALTKDADVEVQNTAIKALASGDSSDYCYSLIEYLYPENYNPYAFDAIAVSKERAVDYLERESSLPGIDDITLARVIRLYGKIGTKNAVNLLLSKMGEIDSHVLMHSIQALVDSRFQASPENKFKIFNHLIKISGFITNNLNIYNLLSGNKKYKLLLDAYAHEIRNNQNQSFMLLSLVYNANVISSLKKMFMYGSFTEISHGIELADHYIDDDIKPVIFPLFEDITIDERIKKLDYYFPQQKMTIKQIISATLTSDFNALSLYPRACAIVLIDQLGLQDFDDELVFCSNHPDKFLSETAQHVISKRNSQVFTTETQDHESDTTLDMLIPGDYAGLLFPRFLELLQFQTIKNLSEYVVIELTKTSKLIHCSAGELINLEPDLDSYSLLLTDAELLESNSKKPLYHNKQFIHISYLKALGISGMIAENNCKIWALEEKTVNELLYDNNDLLNVVLSAIDNLKITE